MVFALVLGGCPLDDNPQAGTGGDQGNAQGDGDKGGDGDGDVKTPSGHHDSGTPADDHDAGHVTEPESDSGMSAMDSGQTPVDSGTPAVDAGHVPDDDAGHPLPDAGHPEPDAGHPEMDAGHPEPDAGHPLPDAGHPVPDAGHPEPDAGHPEPDAGHPEPDAGNPPVVPDLGGASMTDADRAALILSVMTADNYDQDWNPYFESVAEQRPLLFATPSHGTRVRVLQNDVAKANTDKWIKDGLPLPVTMSNGSIIAKETFKLDTASNTYVSNGVLVMAKIDVLDPATYEGKWFFMKISTAGVPARSTSCVNCHNGRTETAAWPPNPDIAGDKGGKADAFVPYDYMIVSYCFDPRTPECAGP